MGGESRIGGRGGGAGGGVTGRRWGALRSKAETGEKEKHMWKTLRCGSGHRRSSRRVSLSGASRWRPSKLRTATCASVQGLKRPETTLSRGPTTAGPGPAWPGADRPLSTLASISPSVSTPLSLPLDIFSIFFLSIPEGPTSCLIFFPFFKKKKRRREGEKERERQRD